MNKFIAFIILWTLFAPPISLATETHDEHKNEHRAHSHGNGKLELVIEGKSVKGSFELPMESLLGFEHLPKTANQKKLLASLQESTQKIANFIKPSDKAGCITKSITASSDLFLGKKSQHSDLDLSFELECQNISELNQIDLVIFNKYQKLKSMKVDLVTAKTQRSFQVKSQKPFINF
jgi:hypothetical protein